MQLQRRLAGLLVEPVRTKGVGAVAALGQLLVHILLHTREGHKHAGPLLVEVLPRCLGRRRGRAERGEVVEERRQTQTVRAIRARPMAGAGALPNVVEVLANSWRRVFRPHRRRAHLLIVAHEDDVIDSVEVLLPMPADEESEARAACVRPAVSRQIPRGEDVPAHRVRARARDVREEILRVPEAEQHMACTKEQIFRDFGFGPFTSGFVPR